MLHKLQFEVLDLFTEFLQDDHIEKIRETFQAIDIDDSGSIEADELIQAFIDIVSKEELSLKSISVEEVEELVYKID